MANRSGAYGVLSTTKRVQLNSGPAIFVSASPSTLIDRYLWDEPGTWWSLGKASLTRLVATLSKPPDAFLQSRVARSFKPSSLPRHICDPLSAFRPTEQWSVRSLCAVCFIRCTSRSSSVRWRLTIAITPAFSPTCRQSGSRASRSARTYQPERNLGQGRVSPRHNSSVGKNARPIEIRKRSTRLAQLTGEFQ